MSWCNKPDSIATAGVLTPLHSQHDGFKEEEILWILIERSKFSTAIHLKSM